MIKKEDIKIGKYYTDDTSVMIIKAIDKDGDPEGALVHFFEGYVSVSRVLLIDFMFNEENEIREISREEFEEKLQEAQKRFETLMNDIKKQLK